MASSQEINNLKINEGIDYYIVHLAKFAVCEHNKKENAHLEFIKVVKATIDPQVEGVLYYITLEASNFGVPQLWMAKVWVKASAEYIELQSFYHVVESKVKEIKENVSPVIEYMSKFAVQEYNRKTYSDLVFVRVLSVQHPGFALYFITLEATKSGIAQSYDARVWVDITSDPVRLKLLDFKPTPPTTA
ncbi:putative Cystatin domain-containing protein [Dioscorea sansibarensis]